MRCLVLTLRAVKIPNGKHSVCSGLTKHLANNYKLYIIINISAQTHGGGVQAFAKGIHVIITVYLPCNLCNLGLYPWSWSFPSLT